MSIKNLFQEVRLRIVPGTVSNNQQSDLLSKVSFKTYCSVAQCIKGLNSKQRINEHATCKKFIAFKCAIISPQDVKPASKNSYFAFQS